MFLKEQNISGREEISVVFIFLDIICGSEHNRNIKIGWMEMISFEKYIDY